MPIPSDQLPIGEGRDKDGNRGASFFVSRTTIEALEQYGPEWKYEDARFIPEAILQPDAIFEGLKRPGQEKSLCYSVRPTHDPDDETETQTLPRYGYVFLVFARSCVGGYEAFDWEWREEDSESPGLPIGHETDFERYTWLKT